MVNVTRDGETVVFDVQGSHKLWAFKSRLEIPRRNIRGARRDPSAVRGWKGWKAPGTHIPGFLTAGTFHLDGKRIFWDVRTPENVVVVDLNDEHYDQLVIEVKNPDAVVDLLSGNR